MWRSRWPEIIVASFLACSGLVGCEGGGLSEDMQAARVATEENREKSLAACESVELYSGGDGSSDLVEAILAHDEKAVTTRLEAGADPEIPDVATGRTALSWAAVTGCVSIIRLLLGEGAQINAPGSRGRTPLMEAARAGNVETAYLLLMKGADPDLSTPEGVTALIYAAEFGHAGIVLSLLEAGANPNEITARTRWTALMDAAFYGHSQIIQLLLEAGADPSPKNMAGLTALDLARDQNNIVSITLLDAAQ